MSPKADRRATACLFLIVTLLFGARVAARYSPLTFLIGDCPYYASTTVSLLYDGDLDLGNQLRGGLDIHGHQIALAADGTWYPKHPVLMPIVAVPWLFVFGVPGLLLFNLAVFAALAIAMMRLARPFAPPWAAALAAFLLIVGTFLRHYDYNFSPDLFATLILTAGLVLLVRGRDRSAGLMMGLAVAARVTHLFLLPLGIAYAAWRRGWRGALRTALGSVGPLLALAALNLALFGSPFTTSYDLNVTEQNGDVFVLSHRAFFDNDLVDGLVGELFDLRNGLVPTAPLLWLALPGIVLMLRRHPPEGLLLIVIAEFLLLFFATYRYWASSHYGNRFLIPLVAAATPAVALALEHMAIRLRAGRTHLRRGTAAAGAAP